MSHHNWVGGLSVSDTLSKKMQKDALGLKVAGVGLGSVDYIADTITLDARAAELFDLEADVALPRDSLHNRIHRDDWDDIEHRVEQLLDPSQPRFIEIEHRVVHSNGDIKWLSARKQIDFGPAPKDTPRQNGALEAPISGLVAIIDITAHKRDKEHIQFLMEELNHRSKNLLTVVQSLARRTFATGDPATFNERFANRLNGLVRNHDELVKGRWVHSDLASLITSHLSAFASVGGPQIKIDGPSVKLGDKANQSIGMAIHELGTNAAKYGALSSPQGKVAIDWMIEDGSDGNLAIRWTETGGPEVATPNREGFGQKVINEMAGMAVGGKVDLQYRPEGVFWQYLIPKSELA